MVRGANPATGLVHLGNGRYYNPAIGRPLQPNPAGGVPTAPQSLNRYAATSAGPVGVGEGAGGGLSPAVAAIGLNVVSAGGGATLTAYATVFGQLHIQANGALLKRAKYQSLFAKIGGTGRNIQYDSLPVTPAKGRTYRVLNTNQIIDLDTLETQARKGWPVSYPKGDPFVTLNDTGLKQWLRSSGGEVVANFAINVALAAPELFGIWNDPYYSAGQKGTQTGVVIGSSAASAGLSTWWATVASAGTLETFGIGLVVGVGVYAGFELIIKPGISWFAPRLGLPDPFIKYRNLQPLGETP